MAGSAYFGTLDTMGDASSAHFSMHSTISYGNHISRQGSYHVAYDTEFNESLHTESLRERFVVTIICQRTFVLPTTLPAVAM